MCSADVDADPLGLMVWLSWVVRLFHVWRSLWFEAKHSTSSMAYPEQLCCCRERKKAKQAELAQQVQLLSSKAATLETAKIKQTRLRVSFCLTVLCTHPMHTSRCHVHAASLAPVQTRFTGYKRVDCWHARYEIPERKKRNARA